MKKILFLMLAAFAVVSCNDDCDHGFNGGGMDSNLLVGSWYEETQNEEDTYSASSAFYSKYCNRLLQGEGQGTYRLDTERNRLTWSYHVNGMGMTSDWKLRDVSKYQFVQYSDVAILTYGKIVDSYTMKGGDTKTISFNELSVQGYESTNEHIATVSSDGIVTATGEKGTAYIKIKCLEANVYVKVIVGDNYPDLWIDYSGLLGNDYTAMKDLLGDPDSSREFDSYSQYAYVTDLHNILKGLRVSINSGTHKIEQIDLIVREGVPQEEVLAYMNAHYYRLEGKYANQYHYSSSSQIELSRAAYAYDTEKNAVLILSGEDYMDKMGLSFWPNLTSLFGLSKTEVGSEMRNRGYTFLQSFDSYSFNGSDAYAITGSDYSTAVELVFNPDNVASEYWMYLSPSVDQAEILNYLRRKYNEDTEEYIASYGFIFYNEQKSLKLVFKAYDNVVVFTDLTKTPVDQVLLRNYWKGLGMTRNEIITEWGAPYMEDNNGKMTYSVVTDNVAFVNFIRDTKSGKVNLINLFLRDEVNPETIKAYLNRLYIFKEETTSDEGPLLRWLNAKSEDDADMRISYYPNEGVVVYKSLIEEKTVPTASDIIPDYSTLISKTAAQVKTSLGKPEREMAGAYVYTPSDNEIVKRFFVRFAENSITETSLTTTVSLNLQENHDKNKVLAYLNGTYTSASEYTTSTSYGYRTMDRSVLIQYSPSSNTIIYTKSSGF